MEAYAHKAVLTEDLAKSTATATASTAKTGFVKHPPAMIDAKMALKWTPTVEEIALNAKTEKNAKATRTAPAPTVTLEPVPNLPARMEYAMALNLTMIAEATAPPAN